MGFYEDLSRHYESVFPVREAQKCFLWSHFDRAGVRSVLDVACGTGAYTREIVRWGLRGAGTDLDESMIARARELASAEGVAAEFAVGDMRDLNAYRGRFDAVICLGNSLPHLLTADDILRALQEMASATGERGLLIVQTVNYDRILKRRPSELPEIRDDQHGIIFRRFYEYSPPPARGGRDLSSASEGYALLSEREGAAGPGLITFRAVLQVPDERGGVREYTNNVPLRPILKSELTEWLGVVGFENPEFFGGFDSSPHSEESQATVAVARKPQH